MSLNNRELTALQEGHAIHVHESLESLLGAANVLGLDYTQLKVRGTVTATDPTPAPTERQDG